MAHFFLHKSLHPTGEEAEKCLEFGAQKLDKQYSTYMYVLLQDSNRGRLGFYAKNKILFGTV